MARTEIKSTIFVKKKGCQPALRATVESFLRGCSFGCGTFYPHPVVLNLGPTTRLKQATLTS